MFPLGIPVPLASLRLLVPPLRLMSAFMWQVAQQQNLEHFDKLEEFVTQVTKVIPELLSARQRTTLILGLRAKMILEMCKGEIPIDLKTVKAHLSGIQSLNMSESSDSEVNALQTNLMKLVMSLLEDPLKKEHFYQEVFPVEYGLDFDKALQVLIGYLLSRLEQLLPVPNFKQAAYYLNAAPSECMQTDCQPELLLSLLKSNYCGNLDKNDLPSIVVDRIISSLSLPPVTEVVISSFGNTDEDLRSLLSSEGPAQVSSNLCQEEDPKCQKVEEVEFQNCFGEEDVDKFGQGVEKIRLATKETQSSACSSPEDDGEPTYEAVNDAATSPVATKITLPLDVHSCAVANKGNQKVNSQKMYSKTPIRQNVTASKPKPQMLLSESLQQRIISELTGSTSSPLVRLSKTVQTGSSIQVLPESATEVTRPISAHTQPPSCSAECDVISSRPEKIFHSTERKTHKCPQCGKCFRYLSELSAHQWRHAAVGPYKCSQCGLYFKTPRHAATHKRRHYMNSNYNCLKCGDSFRSLRDLIKHQTQHRTHSVHQCDQCEKKFTNFRSLMFHKRVHSASEGDDVLTPGVCPPLKCQFCEKLFLRASDLRGHVKTFHPLHTKKTVKTPKVHLQPGECRFCGEIFPLASDLRSHLKIHPEFRPHQCDQCGKCFALQSSLLAHLSNHTGEKPHLCSECGKRFFSKAQLKSHMVSHTGERPHCCSYCGKCFSMSGNLRIHTRIHTGEKPYMCSDCGKCFISAGDLQAHRRTHTGEKPYHCTLCEKSFRVSSHLTEHMRKHTGERPYVCQICGKCFGRKYSWNTHVLTHSANRPFPCSLCSKSYTVRKHLKRHMQTHGLQ